MRPWTVLMAVAALTICCIPEAAYSEPLQRTWSGSGTVEPSGGQREKVRCRVSYSPQGCKVVAVSATCASASTTIRQAGQLSMVTANRYVGDFYNSEYHISGRIRVSLSGSTQTVTFPSPRGKGRPQSQKALTGHQGRSTCALDGLLLSRVIADSVSHLHALIVRG